MSEDIERMIGTFDAALRREPDYSYRLVCLAEIVALKKDRPRAVQLARRALAISDGDPATRMRARQLLGAMLPSYHVSMMNDGRRNAAWDKALRAAIRPGMLALEIGTGAGMLALMAARAGARVVTCETNRVAAMLARELADRNGLGDHIDVLAKHSADLRVGTDLDRPADLLFCDIFADDLLGFNPLRSITDACRRLLAPSAKVVPGAVSMRAALANWHDFERCGHIHSACGFDLGQFADFVPTAIGQPIDASGLEILSTDETIFKFDFPCRAFPLPARTARALSVTKRGEVNAIARWIRLELDSGTALEARPEPGGIFFSGISIVPLEAPVGVQEGDQPVIGAAHDGRMITTWLEHKRVPAAETPPASVSNTR